MTDLNEVIEILKEKVPKVTRNHFMPKYADPLHTEIIEGARLAADFLIDAIPDSFIELRHDAGLIIGKLQIELTRYETAQKELLTS
jgi:hypothetical protein